MKYFFVLLSTLLFALGLRATVITGMGDAHIQCMESARPQGNYLGIRSDYRSCMASYENMMGYPTYVPQMNQQFSQFGQPPAYHDLMYRPGYNEPYVRTLPYMVNDQARYHIQPAFNTAPGRGPRTTTSVLSL